MPATTRLLSHLLWLMLSAVFLLEGGISAARADDLLAKQRRINAIRTQELKFKMAGVLRDTREEGRKNPTEAVDLLRELRTEVEEARYLDDADRKELLRRLDTEISRYRDKVRPLKRPLNARDRPSVSDRS